MKRNPKLQKYYREQIESLISNGYARPVTQKEITESPNGSYLPHHVAICEEKESTPYRIVFDAASKCDGISLNDILLKGPNFTNSLVNVFLRFREDETAITGDVRKMFHQIYVHPED